MDMVWCAVSEHEIIGTHFFENETVTSKSYKRMLRYYLNPRLRVNSAKTIFQKNGTPHIPLQLYKITWTINFLEGGWGGLAQLHGRRTLRT